jgi:hypothetical protein
MDSRLAEFNSDMRHSRHSRDGSGLRAEPANDQIRYATPASVYPQTVGK